MRNNNDESNRLDSKSPDKMQNAHFRGEGAEKPKFNYQCEDFVDEVRDYLQPDSEGAKACVGDNIYKHFYRHSAELLKIRRIIGAPPCKRGHVPVEVTREQRFAVLEVILISEHPKPLKFFVSELWGLDFSKAQLEVKSVDGNGRINENVSSGGTGLTMADGDVDLVESEIFYDGREAINQLRRILSDSSAEQRAMTKSELASFASVFAESTKVAIDHTRQHLETMLLIGAGMIFMRFQRRLLEKAEYKSFDDNIRAVLREHFRSVSDGALKSTLGRISRAYRHAMSVHLATDSPLLSDHAKLWEFYKKSLPEIPALVDRYIEGGFDYRDLNGIPFLPSMGNDGEKEPKPTPEKPEWEKYIKLLRILFKAAEAGRLEKFVKARSETLPDVIEATLFSIEKIREFYEAAGRERISAHSDEIQKEVQFMNEVAQRISGNTK